MSVSFAVFSKFALLRSQILKRGSFALFVRISAMQIIGSGQIVTFVTSVVPTFLNCIALFYFFILLFFFCFALFVRMRLGCFASADATTGFALWIPTTFEKVDETLSVWVCLVLTTAAACYLPICGKLNAAAPPKKKQKNCRKI